MTSSEETETEMPLSGDDDMSHLLTEQDQRLIESLQAELPALEGPGVADKWCDELQSSPKPAVPEDPDLRAAPVCALATADLHHAADESPYIFPHASSAPAAPQPPLSSPVRPAGDRFVTSAVNNAIPALEDWPGPLEFSASVLLPEQAGRQLPVVYNAQMKKLYVDIMIGVQFGFSVKKGTDTSQLRVSALPVYPEMHHVNTPVRRCPTHRELGHETNLNAAEHLEHVIRADTDRAVYVSSGTTNERRSVVVPFEPPQPGTQEFRMMYLLCCMNTCVGGINRRRLMLLFTLEHSGTGETLGRSVVEVKVCKCPHRDYKSDLKRLHGRDVTVADEKPSKRRREISPTRSRTGPFMLDCGSEAMLKHLRCVRDSLLSNMAALSAQQSPQHPLPQTQPSPSARVQSSPDRPEREDREPTGVPVPLHRRSTLNNIKMELL